MSYEPIAETSLLDTMLPGLLVACWWLWILLD